MIYGHEEIRKMLKEKLEAGKLPPAMVFSGPDGVGKRLVADELWAREYPGEVTEDPVNIFRLRPRDTGHGIIGIDEIRGKEITTPKFDEEADESIGEDGGMNSGLKLWAQLAPPEGKSKWCVIEGADRLYIDAANMLLKLLEEGSPNTYFIFLTNNFEALLPTIQSRMVQIEFDPLPMELVEKIGQELGMTDPRWIEFNPGAIEYPDQESFERALVHFDAWCALMNGRGMLSKEGACLIPVKEEKGLSEAEQLRKPLKILQRLLTDSSGIKLGLPLSFPSFKEKIPKFQNEVSRRTGFALKTLHYNFKTKFLLHYILQGLQ